MSEFVKPYAEWAAAGIELLGIAVIIVLAGYSLLYGAIQLVRRTREAETVDFESLDTLFRNPRDSDVAGLVRYEGDRWRAGEANFLSSSVSLVSGLMFCSLGLAAVIVALRRSKARPSSERLP